MLHTPARLAIPLILTAIMSSASLHSAPRAEIRLSPFLAGLSRPVHALFAPESDGLLYVVEQRGLLAAYRAGRRSVVLDLTDRTNTGSEEGLLSAAIESPGHTPGSGKERRIFVSYTTGRRPSHSVVSSFPLMYSAGEPRAAKEKESIILRVRQPYSNHNGGHILFGQDGRLYIGLGDGGSAGDPQGHGQNPRSLLGKILRIAPREGGGYSIPADNPFRGRPSFRPEIFALGLRNPWRMSFDAKSGLLYAGDVGQNRQEEITLVGRGSNHGWNRIEGRLCFRPRTRCNRQGLVSPLQVYGRAEGTSVTGGFVYRGEAIRSLAGAYVFADYVSGRIWALPLGPSGRPNGHVRLLLSSGLTISSFAEDNARELYVLDHQGGRILKITRNS